MGIPYTLSEPAYYNLQGPVYASMPTSEGVHISQGSYSPIKGSYYSQQPPTRGGNYSRSLGSSQQFPGQRFCFNYGVPDHMMQQCTSQRSCGVQPNFSFQVRPPVPQGRGRGIVQSSRDGRASNSGVAAQQGGDRGTTQDGCGRGVYYYIFPQRPKTETFDAIITGIILVCHQSTSLLYDPGSTFSYVSFDTEFNMIYDSMTTPIRVSTPLGKPVVGDRVQRSYPVSYARHDTFIYLIIMGMVDFMLFWV